MAGHPLTSFDFGGSPAALAPPPLPPDTPPGLVARLRESFLDYPGGLLYPPLATFDDAPNWPAGWGRGATGAVGDRRAGRDLPKFWSELDLRAYRVMSRWLWDTNPFMIGFGGRLVDYHVRKGFQWQACLKGQKKMAYATASNQKQTPDGAIVEKAQNVLDAWRDAVDWPLRSREGFRRLRRDGEVCQRFGVASRGELPWVRWVNPEQVGSPVGETDGVDSYGVRTGEGDTEHVTALHVWDHDDQALRGEWVNADPHDPAARLVFAKTNTDADVKRGLPDSFSLHECMDEARKVVRNMVVSTAPMAAQSWREKFATATGDQVRGLIPTTLPDPRQAGWPQSSPTIYSDRMLAGTVVRVEGNREFEPGPTATGAGSFVEVVQAALRTACVRWGLPPYMTAKADDINFASSLTAGSPFAVAVEGGQVEWSAYERRTALKVLDLAVESGLLTREERGRLDVHVVEPTVVTPDPAAATARRKTLLDAKVVDPYTVMQEEGYDPSHIEANWKAWNERNPQQPPPGQQPGQGGEDGGGADGPGGGDGGGEDPLAGLLGESVARPGDLLHLMAAVLAAHARGGAVDADAVAELAGDPDALADAVDEAGGTVAESVLTLLEKWAGFKTSRGTTGATDGTRKVYGQRAKDLLAAQDRRDKGEPDPEHPARKLAKDLKAGREPAREKARAALSAALADPAKVRPEHVTELAEHLPALTRDEARAALAALGKKVGGRLKADIVKGLIDHITAQAPVPLAGGDDERGRGAGTADAGAGGPVAKAAGGPGGEGRDLLWHDALEPPGRTTARSVPASTGEVNKRLDRFEAFFRKKGNGPAAEWLGKLREHVNAVGAESALAAVGGPGDGKAAGGKDPVQYWGVAPDEANWKHMGAFMERYLARNGIIAVTGDTSAPDFPLVSALGGTDRFIAGQDFRPASMHYTNKLDEAKDLPGLESSEDLGKVMGGAHPTHLTDDVIAKLDEQYGKGQWIVKCYDDNAAAGYGIFFPQRAAAVRDDARNTLWNAGSALANYGFSLDRDDTGKVTGLRHSGGDVYPFGSERYEKTIGGDARQWGDRARAAADHENGAMLPDGSFMVQPAFPAVGISDAERAAGKTWHEKNEGRVHLVTRPDGSVDVVPHSTWLKGGNLPVVFEDDDTRAMAAAAKAAIEKIPHEARKGQVYAPDIMKTADGYKVVELNAQGDHNGSGYLHDNHFTIDAYTSFLTGRVPAHVQFIRSLLTKREKPA